MSVLSTSSTHTPASFNGTLMPHQLDALAFLQKNERALCAIFTGGGKTATAAGLTAWMLDNGDLQAVPDAPAVVVLTDPSLIAQTAEELQRFCPALHVSTSNHPRHKATTPSAKALRDALTAQGNIPLILVAGYPWWLARQTTTGADWLPQLVILDEVTAVSGGGSQHAAVLNLSGRAQRVVGLSATPYQSNPLQIYSILESIGTPNLWSRNTFEREFISWREPRQLSTYQWTPRVPEGFASEQRQKEFSEYLHSVMFRVLPEDTGQVLPVLTRRVERIPLHPIQERAYQAASLIPGQHGLVKMQTAARHVGVVSSLVDELVRQLTGPHRRKQAVVYCETLDVLPLAAEALRAADVTSVTIEGKDGSRDRENALACFRDGRVRVLLGSAVLERGLNLQYASLLISLDSSWTDDREAQREGRIRRLGSQHAECLHLVLMPDTGVHRAKQARVDARGATARSVLEVE